MFPSDRELFAGFEEKYGKKVPWPDFLPLPLREKKALEALRDWHDISEPLFEWATILLLALRGEEWLRANPRVFLELDTVYHSRGAIIAAGWKPPRYVTFRNTDLCFDEHAIRSLLS